jgi:starvation-inducible outer membrane lipoprotein
MKVTLLIVLLLSGCATKPDLVYNPNQADLFRECLQHYDKETCQQLVSTTYAFD